MANYLWGKSFPSQQEYATPWQDKSVVRTGDTTASIETVDTLARQKVSGLSDDIQSKEQIITDLSDKISQVTEVAGVGDHTVNIATTVFENHYFTGTPLTIRLSGTTARDLVCFPCVNGNTYNILYNNAVPDSNHCLWAKYLVQPGVDVKSQTNTLIAATDGTITPDFDGWICIRASAGSGYKYTVSTILSDNYIYTAVDAVARNKMDLYEEKILRHDTEIQNAVTKANDAHDIASSASNWIDQFEESYTSEQDIAITWVSGYFQPVTGVSSTATSYRRSNPSITANNDDTIYIETPEGYKTFVVWFSDEPDYSNKGDNSAIFVGAIQPQTGNYSFVYDSRYHYNVCIDLRDSTNTAQPVVYPRVYRKVVTLGGDSSGAQYASAGILAKDERLSSDKSYAIKNNNSGMNIIVSCDASYTGTPPRIYASYTTYGNTMNYPLNGKHQEWRLPPMDNSMGNIALSIEIPDGTTANIACLRYRFDNEVHHGAITYHSHFGVHGTTQTVQSALKAARVGFRSFIMVPQEIKKADGTLVIVASHDEWRTIGGVKRYFLRDDLTDDQLQNPPMTYEELIASNPNITFLQDLLDVCAKTGMRPMFSTHPNPSDEAWETIKSMLVRYGLIGRLQIKAAPSAVGDMNNPEKSILARAYNHFSDSIDSYTLDVSHTQYTGNFIEHIKTLKWYSPLLCKIEYIESNDPTDTTHRIDAALLAAAKAEGLTISAAMSDNSKRTVERMQELIALGVTEFTQDIFYSFGLSY